MPNHYIDTHTHLFVEQFDDDLPEVILRAEAAGVTHMLLPNIDDSTIAQTIEVVEQYAACKLMLGLHPCSVAENVKSQLQTIEKAIEQNEIVGVGEIGLDYYWDTKFSTAQREAFSAQLQMAIDLRKPVSIHTREAFDDAIALVEKKQNGYLRGVFHCFGGSVDDGKRAIDAGMHLGIGGNSTFKKSTAPSTLPALPLEALVLETDAPYLAPVPYRGKRNEPSYLPLIAENLASIYEKPLELIASRTTQTAKEIYGL